MIDLTISLDCGLFGNGRGEVLRDIVEPADRLPTLCDQYGVRVAIVFEVGQYRAFREWDVELRRNLGCSSREAVEEQVRRAVRTNISISPRQSRTNINSERLIVHDR